jgi:hypothetical protein
MDDPVTLTITDRDKALLLYRILEPNAVCREIFLQLSRKMREVGWA